MDEVTGCIVDAALKIHIRLGPGLLESVYTTVLARELKRRGLRVLTEVTVEFDFDGMHFDQGLRVDLLVEDLIVVEIKSVDRVAPVHSKQVLTYLRLLDLRVGLLINFGAATLSEGVRRVVNKYAPNTTIGTHLRVNSPPPIEPTK